MCNKDTETSNNKQESDSKEISTMIRATQHTKSQNPPSNLPRALSNNDKSEENQDPQTWPTIGKSTRKTNAKGIWTPEPKGRQIQKMENQSGKQKWA